MITLYELIGRKIIRVEKRRDKIVIVMDNKYKIIMYGVYMIEYIKGDE